MKPPTIDLVPFQKLRNRIDAAGGPPPHLQRQYRTACQALAELECGRLGNPAAFVLYGLAAIVLAGASVLGYSAVTEAQRAMREAGRVAVDWMPVFLGGVAVLGIAWLAAKVAR